MTSPNTPQPTQVQHPWRATVRTVVAITLALLPVLPEIAEALGIATLPVVMTILGIAAGITRVLALPQVQAILQRYKLTAWLAATPKPTDQRP